MSGESVRIDRIVVLVFSADPAPAVQRKEHALVVLDPSARTLTLEQDLTWDRLAAAVGPHLRPGTLWAVDFPLSFPRGFVAHETGTPETWEAALEWADVHGELTLAVGRPPFWGRHGFKRLKPPELAAYGCTGVQRATDREYPPAKSVFQVAGPDAIGTAALRGMAWLRRSGLRSRVHAWPFDGAAADGGRPILAEVLSRSFWPDMRIEDPKARAARVAAIRDAGWTAADPLWDVATPAYPFRAVTAAVGLATLLAEDPVLLGDPAREPVSDPAVRYEGWALGPRGAPASAAGGGGT